MDKNIWYGWGGFNETLFHWVNSFHSAAYDKCMIFITNLGMYEFFYPYLAIISLYAAVELFLLWKRKQHKPRLRAWLLVFLTILIAVPLDHHVIDWLKSQFNFPRPFIALPKGSFWAITPDINFRKYWEAFPSGHAAFAMVMGASLWPVLGRTGKILIAALVALVGISRIALGMHFPADVIGGFAVAFAVVFVVRLMLRKILRQF